eukprot:jgi/Psemu1/228389/e_gw1.2330.6.1
MSHVIPKGIIDQRGYRWLVRNSSNATQPLEAPSHTENDLVLFDHLSCNSDENNDELQKVSCGFSITGEELRPLLIDGTVRTGFPTPIVVADAMMLEREYFQGLRLHFRVLFCPTECHVRILRLRDMKSCCVYRYEPNDSGSDFEKHPSVYPLDRSNIFHLDNLSIDELNFEEDFGSGRINLFDDTDFSEKASVGSFEEASVGKRRLSFQNSPQANAIKARFPYWFIFEATLNIGVSVDRKIVITGVSLDVRKTHSDEDWCPIALFHNEGEDREGRAAPNNGVTIAHVLSELYCPEESDDALAPIQGA